MGRHRWKWNLPGVALLAAAVLGGGLSASGQVVRVRVQPGQEPAEAPPAAQPARFWIGTECVPLRDEVLRAQLNLPEGQGLIVRDVVPDSPAAKAGLQRHDVLVASGDEPLGEVHELVALVQSGKPLGLQVLRGGKKITIEVQPAERPDEAQVDKLLTPPERRAIIEWFEPLLKPHEGNLPKRFRIVRPGVPGIGPPLPKDLRVTIERSGDQPAKITVRRDEETWEVTEDTLDKLPPDVRPHVERMLRGPTWVFDRVMPAVPDTVWQALEAQPLEAGRAAVSKRLDDLNRRLDTLQETVRRLQNQLGQPAPEDAPRDEAPAKAPPQEVQ